MHTQLAQEDVNGDGALGIRGNVKYGLDWRPYPRQSRCRNSVVRTCPTAVNDMTYLRQYSASVEYG